MPVNYAKNGKIRSLVTPTIFLISLLVCFFDPGTGRMVLFLIPFAMAYIGRKIRKENAVVISHPGKKVKKR